MDKILPELYRNYGLYSNYRNFPLALDGLKPVERRVLLSAYKIARNKFVKSRQVDAYTIGHYHPHGECYGTIVQLVRQGFLIGQGNFGTNVGVEPIGPAAPRYTECRISPLALDVAFKYVEYVPWVDTELDDKEPQFLPAMYPMCLMGTEYTQGIGFGFRTYIPCYTVSDLHKRLLWLLGIRKRKPIIKPITDCEIVSDPKVLDELLTTGKAKIDVEGIIEVDTRLNKVKLRSWPPGKRFESFLNKFQKELSENMIGFSDLSVTETEIVFQVMRERNRDKIFKEFVDKLRTAIKGTISFETIVTDENQKVKVTPIDEMLINTFNRFREINDVMLKDKIKKAKLSIAELNTLAIIKPVLTKCLENGYDVDQTLEIIEKETPLEKETIGEIINKYMIRKLLTINTNTIQLKSRIVSLQDAERNLTDIVLQQYGGN
jgi:DNA gyrase/topoisomerase IV subunit A